MTNLDSILKSRDITVPTKVCLVKAMVFPVVMYRCETWTIKKAERWRIDPFQLWCWRRLLRVPWIARRSNQSILKEISPEYSLEGLMVKVKLQYFGHLMQRTDWLEKTFMLGKIEVRRRGQQRLKWHHRLDGHEFEQAPGVGDEQGSLACCSPWGCKEPYTTKQLNWTELKCHQCFREFSLRKGKEWEPMWRYIIKHNWLFDLLELSCACLGIEWIHSISSTSSHREAHGGRKQKCYQVVSM